MNTITCAVCGAVILRKETDKWCYHVSFPGPVCRHHHGVKEEYDRLLAEASKNLDECTNHCDDPDWAAMCCLDCGEKVRYPGDEQCDTCLDKDDLTF